jgi:SAM-dependent methyltransferase
MYAFLRQTVTPIARPVWRRIWARFEARLAPIESRLAILESNSKSDAMDQMCGSAHAQIGYPLSTAADAGMSTGRRLIDIYANFRLDEIVANSSLVELNASVSARLNLPPQAFIGWVRSLDRLPFDGIAPSPKYIKPPSFFVSQVHRLWLTLEAIRPLVKSDATVVDLGSYPFAVPIALRCWSGHGGRIIATVIQSLDAASEKKLHDLRIETCSVDLDPYVQDRSGRTPPRALSLNDGEADAVVLTHVIEHLYHPMDILREAHRILRPGGAIIVSTDNGMMAQVFLNLIGGERYLQEPVEGTCAMTMHDWRGHVRFFSANDITIMLGTEGFETQAPQFAQCFYDILLPEYFRDPVPKLPKWQLDLILEHPQFRNDLIVIGRKPD